MRPFGGRVTIRRSANDPEGAGRTTPPKTAPQPALPQPPTPGQTKGPLQPRRRTAIGFSATSLTFGRWWQPASPVLRQTSGLHQPRRRTTIGLSAHIAHLPATTTTCHPDVQTKLGLAPNSPTNGFRAHGPQTFQPRPSSTGHGLLLPLPSFRPRRHFRQPVRPGHISGLHHSRPADGLRAYGPYLSIVGGSRFTAASAVPPGLADTSSNR